MKKVIVEVSGGVAEVTHADDGVRVVVFDWDDYRDSDDEQRKEMLLNLRSEMGDLASVVIDQVRI